MELDLLALVGDGVDAFLVAALGDKVALAVVAAEKIVEIGKQRVLVPLIAQRVGEPGAQVAHNGNGRGINAQVARPGNSMLQFLPQFRASPDWFACSIACTWGNSVSSKKRINSSRLMLRMR